MMEAFQHTPQVNQAKTARTQKNKSHNKFLYYLCRIYGATGGASDSRGQVNGAYAAGR